MTATASPLVLFEVFPNATGKEYTLHWSNGNTKEERGWVRMTDLMFNHWFFPNAFGLDGANETRTVRATTGHRMTRRIGGPETNVKGHASYSIKVVPTYRSNGYDTGEQFFAIDGDDLWNFEVGGRITEFRIWLQKVAKDGNLRRTFSYRTITGVGATAVPFLTVNP
jgi:hypothetical protein